MGGLGNDRLSGSSGNDLLDGGDGIDTATYHWQSTAGVTVNLSVSGGQNTGGAGVDTLVSIENLAGSAFGDELTGDSNANGIEGMDGSDTLTGAGGDDSLLGAGENDVLQGNAGDDWLDGGSGADTMIGGTGHDFYTVDVAGDVVIETALNEWDHVHSHLTAYTLPANVENASIELTGAANLTGNALNNFLESGRGDNVINGADGIDMVSYEWRNNGGVTVSLAISTAQNTGGAGTDTLISIEDIRGTWFDDQLTGHSAAAVSRVSVATMCW